jgi:hypothetical protein
MTLSNQQYADLKLLQLRNLILDKEAAIQNMTRENRADGWLSDWSLTIRVIDEEITAKQREILGL